MMARNPTIVQRIKLEGGKKLEKELRALRKTGEEAFRLLTKAIRRRSATRRARRRNLRKTSTSSNGS